MPFWKPTNKFIPSNAILRPIAADFNALNAKLLDGCIKRQQAKLRGQTETIAERMKRDTAALMALPAVAFDACHKISTRVSSLSLVRYRSNDYSVPTEYGHREVLVKGYVDHVDICLGTDIIARHVRSYGREEFIYNPLHYLALLEQKPRALDQAAPLQDWVLPEYSIGCGACWKSAWNAVAARNISRFCGCWRISA